MSPFASKIESCFALCVLMALIAQPASGKVADRSRLVKHRQNSGRQEHFHDNGRPLEGQAYRLARGDREESSLQAFREKKEKKPWIPPPRLEEDPWERVLVQADEKASNFSVERQLGNQPSGCCYDYQSYSASQLCAYYGNDCESGETPSHDSGDDDCSQEGLSFIGISFSVNTATGNPYSYQLCDQFPMENIIDRDYEYVMSMDEDGWLVGGGYKQFDYSGKMP